MAWAPGTAWKSSAYRPMFAAPFELLEDFLLTAGERGNFL